MTLSKITCWLYGVETRTERLEGVNTPL